MIKGGRKAGNYESSETDQHRVTQNNCGGGVIALHYNYGRALDYVQPNSANQILLLLIESMFACCVNVFLIISGYFSWRKSDFKTIKAFNLLLEVISVRLFFSLVPILTNRSISIKRITIAFLPMNYFVILYIAVMLLSPFVNTLLRVIKDKALGEMLIISVILFCGIPYVIDSVHYITGYDLGDLSTLARYGSSYGYSFMNFMLMYLIGAYFGKKKTRWSKKKLAFLLALLWLLLIMLGYYANREGYDINFAYSYCSPFVILSAVFSFLIFKELEIRQSKIVNGIASATFTVYLTHGYFLNYLQIEKYANASTMVLLTHELISIILLWAMGFLIYTVWDKLTNRLFSAIEKRFPVVSVME